MCLTQPGKVVRVEGDFASVDYRRSGVREGINISLVKIGVGDYVLVQGGFAIKVLSKKEAEESLKAWEALEFFQSAEAEAER